MRFFDSLTHVTQDGSWFGERHCDASAPRLLDELQQAGAERALLVAIAGYQSNDYTMEVARAHPTRFVPIAGFNPVELPTTRRIEAVLKGLKAQGFAGIKLHPRLNGYDPLDDKMQAAVDIAGELGLTVLLDTLFRRRGLATRHAPDVIDQLAAHFPHTRMLLLHGTGPTMLELYEIVRACDNLLLDLSFTLLRYQGSQRLDDDMHFLFKTTDQLVTIGSDFPEASPAQALARFAQLSQGIEQRRIENILWNNLNRWFPLPP
ncbi:MAG: amidohydrolase family protein [Burkholderiales bacterium]|nr:amidohydrolase family protein [Burkholderiales bacterium]